MKSGAILAVLALATMLLLPACTLEDTGLIDPTSTPESYPEVEVGGDLRNYLLHVPETEPPSDGWPLVIVVHGLGGNAAQMRQLTGFDELADREGFVAIYPNGLARAWLDAGVGAIFTDTDIATLNLEFMDAMIDDLGDEIEFEIDSDRIYVAGLSNGGMFAFHSACHMSDRIAAIGLVAAASISQSFESCDPEEPVSYIAFHGTGDTVVPYAGGPIIAGIEELGEYQSAHVTAEFWADVNGCQAEPAREELPDTIEGDTSTASRETWPECDAGTNVVLVTLEGSGHTWPGHPSENAMPGSTNLDIDATEMLWEFFESHPKSG